MKPRAALTAMTEGIRLNLLERCRLTDLPSLMRCFESLGNNCEFGIVQRAAGYDPPGLFRNVGFNLTEQMVHAIETGLDGMFEAGAYTLVKPDGWPDYRLDCLRHGFQFHTGVNQSEPPEKAAASVGVFRTMKRFFLSDLQEGRKIYVYRHADHQEVALPLIEALLRALRRHGPNRLLAVAQDTDPDARFAYVRQVRDDLMMAGTPRLSAENPPYVNFAAWEKLLRQAVDMRATGGAASTTVHRGPCDDQTPLFALQWDSLQPGTEVTVEAEINIPADSGGTRANLVAWGYESRNPRMFDAERLDVWQPVAVSAIVPDGGSIAVPALLGGTGDGQMRVLSRNWRIRATAPRRTYKAVSWTELPPAAVAQVVPQADIDVPLAPIAYGQVARPDFPVREYPQGGWTDRRVHRSGIVTVTLRDAVIHGAGGAVTVGDHILTETIRLARFGAGGVVWEDETANLVSLGHRPPSVRLPSGTHVFSGFPGIHNYAHFLVDMVPAAAPPVTPPDATLIWPLVPHPWQAAYFDLLAVSHRSVTVPEDVPVACAALRLTPLSLIDSGHFPHPGRIAVIDRLKARVGCNPARRRKLYVARSDTSLRPLVNEPALIEMLTGRGFEVLTLRSMTVADQIRAFAEATHVVAPHGAGCANVIFCPRGSLFLELHVDSYVQWSMRRTASVVPLRYGCVLGHEVAPWQDAPDQVGGWTVDLARVRDALDQAGG